MTTLSVDAANFTWLLAEFSRSVPGVQHTLAVSADGLLMAMSADLDRTAGDQLAAIVFGLASLTHGAARQLGSPQVRQTVVEMDDMFLFATGFGDGTVLAVVADATCDPGTVGTQMALLVERSQAVLTPRLAAEMRARLPFATAARV